LSGCRLSANAGGKVCGYPQIESNQDAAEGVAV
jgi:hypothetical protein